MKQIYGIEMFIPEHKGIVQKPELMMFIIFVGLILNALFIHSWVSVIFSIILFVCYIEIIRDNQKKESFKQGFYRGVDEAFEECIKMFIREQNGVRRIIEWAKYLSDDIAEEFVENARKEKTHLHEYSSLSQAITSAFLWDEYPKINWREVYEEARDLEKTEAINAKQEKEITETQPASDEPCCRTIPYCHEHDTEEPCKKCERNRKERERKAIKKKVAEESVKESVKPAKKKSIKTESTKIPLQIRGKLPIDYNYKDWALLLPKTVRGLFIWNIENQGKNLHCKPNVFNAAEALFTAFDWSETTQGFEFWQEVRNNLKKKLK